MEELVYTENDELYSFVVNNDSENGFSIKKQKHYSNSFEEQNGGFFDQHLSNGDVTSYRRLENGNYEITFVNIQQTGNSDEEKIEFLKEVMTFVITEDGIVLSFMLEGGYSTLDLKTGVQTEYEIPGITLYEYDYEAEVLDKIYQLISMAQETDVTSNA